MALNNVSAISVNTQSKKRFLSAFELSNSKWRLVFSNGEHFRHRTIETGDREVLDDRFPADIEGFITGDGRPLPLELKSRIASSFFFS